MQINNCQWFKHKHVNNDVSFPLPLWLSLHPSHRPVHSRRKTIVTQAQEYSKYHKSLIIVLVTHANSGTQSCVDKTSQLIDHVMIVLQIHLYIYTTGHHHCKLNLPLLVPDDCRRHHQEDQQCNNCNYCNCYPSWCGLSGCSTWDVWSVCGYTLKSLLLIQLG